jgi:hypothetical protein
MPIEYYLDKFEPIVARKQTETPFAFVFNRV